MKAFLDAALEKQKLILLTLALILVAGAITYIGMPKESNPDVPVPYIYVFLAHEGISPEDAERLLVRPAEQALRSIEGIKKMQSRAFQGFGTVTLEFDAGFDNQKALRDVQRKIDEVKSKLPTDAEEPAVQEINAALDPVLIVDLSGAVPERSLLALARNLKDDLAGLKGVLEVEIGGDREEMVEILVDPVKMDSYGISQDELFNLFVRNNRLIAAGVLDTGNGRFAVKLPGVIENVQDVQSLPVKVSGDRVVKFSDIATITRSFKDPSSFARRNGERSVTLEIVKRIGENVIQTNDRVKAMVAEHQKHWPASVRVAYSLDESKDIKEMLNDLQNGVLTAVILVVCVLIGYLGWRTASLVAIAVPGSFLMGILVLAMLGLTINVVVLFSLIMAVGMLVDDAIVVSEYADRKMCEGFPPAVAYRDAVKRMAWPIISSTLTRLAAFFPLLFWPGIIGGFMKFLPITLIATLSASLVMALIFIPTLGALWGSADSHSREEQKRIAAAETGDMADLRGGSAAYVKVLSWAVDHPRKTFLIALAMLVGIFGSYFFLFGVGVEFFPQTEAGSARINIHARGDLSIYEKDAVMREVESRILDIPDLKSVNANAGSTGRNASADTIGYLRLDFKEWNERRKASEILAEVRKRIADMPGVVVEIEVQRNGPSQGKPVQLELSSPVPESLEASNARLGDAIAAIRAAMDQVGGFTDVEDSRPLSGIEWQLEVNRAEAAKYGADITLIGNAVQLVTNGVLLGKYRPEDTDDEIDIRARYTAPYRNLQQLANLRMQTRDGLIPISNFVERRAAQKVGSILRIGGKRVMNIEADVAPGLLADTQVRKLQKYFEEHPAPALTENGVRVSFTGEQEEQAESQAFLQGAFFLAIFIMIAILVTQFNSFYQTALVLSAVLFSTAAVFLGLMILHEPFGIVMGGIGVIALAGVIVNNNIILIDTYNHLRRDDHMAPREALLRTGAMRLRPVLLTAGTAILGLLPMAFGVNPDIIHRVVTIGSPSSQFWIQLASAIAGGLAFATPITLILTPALLMWRELRQARKTVTPPAPGRDLSAEFGENPDDPVLAPK
jgi:multidrug efflux pump